MSGDEQSRVPDDLDTVWSEREILAQAEALGQVGAWAWIIATDQVWWSAETYRILGWPTDEGPIDGAAVLTRVHPDDRSDVAARLETAIAGTGSFDVRHRVLAPDGTVRHVRNRGRVLPGEDGHAARVLGMVLDVTDDVLLHQERDAALAALATSEARYRLLAEHAWDVVWTMGVDGAITYVSPSVERVRGITPATAMTQPLEEIHPPDSAERVREYFGRLYAAIDAGLELPTFHGEQEYYRADGSIMLGELDVIPQVDASGTVVQILGVTRDISERRRLEQELNRLAVTDPLTGVWNRRQGEDLIGSDLVDRRSGGATPLSLLMVDIDHFKTINDSHGHQTGDRILVEVTRLLADGLRASDVLARWGGDEFVILLRSCGVDDARTLAESLRAAIEARSFEDVATVTVCIGAAEIAADEGLESCLQRADAALYDAKRSGRNAVRTAA